MKIIDFNLTRESEFVIAQARVIFEDCGRPEQSVYIKTQIGRASCRERV